MKRVAGALLVLALWASCLPGLAGAQELADGVIDGRVVNGTEGGGSVAGVGVTLYMYGDSGVAGTRSMMTDEEGEFQFAEVPTAYEYLVSAKYMAVDYYSSLAFEAGETKVFVEVPVCDATTSDEAVKTALGHTIIRVEEEGFEVTEVLWLVNEGDRTFVGNDGVLVFTLPEAATDFESTGELIEDFLFMDGNKVTYAVPFPPGERQLLYSYRLPKSGPRESVISLELAYHTYDLEVMVGGDDIEVSTAQLAPAEPVETEDGEEYIHLWGENLAGGTVVSLRISSETGGIAATSVMLWVLAGATVIAVAVWLTRQARRKRRGADEDG